MPRKFKIGNLIWDGFLNKKGIVVDDKTGCLTIFYIENGTFGFASPGDPEIFLILHRKF